MVVSWDFIAGATNDQFQVYVNPTDTTVENNPTLKSYDLGVRNSNGLMIEVMRNLGFYAQFGETIGFVRWLRFEIDFGLGVQARFP